MCELSLLQVRAGSLTSLKQDHQAGRLGLVADPLGFADVSRGLAYEIANHYASPLPRV